MADVIHEASLNIGGDWRPGQGHDGEVENPATEQTTGVITQASADDVDAAVGAARAAFEPWAWTTIDVRVQLLQRLHAAISERADAFADIITRELGALPALARRLHVDVGIADVLEIKAVQR